MRLFMHSFHDIDRHSSCFLPFEVGIHEFRSICVLAKEREKYGSDCFCVFLEICEKKSDVFESVTVFLYLWNGGFY